MALEVFLEHPIEYAITTFRPLIKMYAETNYLNVLGSIRRLEIVFNLALTAIPVLSRSGSGMDTRARTPFTFSLAILAAQGIFWIWKRYNNSIEIS